MKDLRHRGRERREEQGSVLILALMVMLILTILGLALVAVTETEMQLGGAERVQMSTFYAAETGTSIATARVLDGAFEPTSFLIKDDSSAHEMGYQVQLTRTAAVAVGPCDFCAVNEDQTSWSYKVTYLVNSTAVRRDWASLDPDAASNPDGSVQAQDLVSVTFEIQPSEPPRTTAVATDVSERGRFKL